MQNTHTAPINQAWYPSHAEYTTPKAPNPAMAWNRRVDREGGSAAAAAATPRKKAEPRSAIGIPAIIDAAEEFTTSQLIRLSTLQTEAPDVSSLRENRYALAPKPTSPVVNTPHRGLVRMTPAVAHTAAKAQASTP
jgi:hypothetical protein